MLISLDRFCLIEFSKNPSAVELSKRRGVAGCGWPSSRRVVQIGTASWPLMKAAPILASAAESMTLLMILETVKMVPLRVVSVWGGKSGFGERSLRK